MRLINRRGVGAAAILVLMAGLGAAAGAQRPDGAKERGFGPRGGVSRLVEFLELTEAQQEQWKAAHHAQGETMKDLHTRLRDNRTQLHEAIESDSPNPTEIGELTLEGRALRAEAEANRAELHAALEAVLTPEQVEKWQAYEAARGDRGRGFGRRGPRGPRAPRGPGHGHGSALGAGAAG